MTEYIINTLVFLFMSLPNRFLKYLTIRLMRTSLELILFKCACIQRREVNWTFIADLFLLNKLKNDVPGTFDAIMALRMTSNRPKP